MKRFNKKQEPRIPINHYIKYPEVRVTGSDGEQLGIMSKDRAVGLAKDQGLDLVLVTERADPPVCKIIEFGKHQYEQKKREKERAKQARANRVDIHEIQFRPMIGQGDMDVKFKKIRELNWPFEEKPRGSSSKGRKVEKVALYISIGKAWR
jgi:translation initiation factor IF-3